ncbi:MAG: type secretion system secretin GspD [Pseudomonadota bacterium]|jgi:general secretion pathway protein D
MKSQRFKTTLMHRIGIVPLVVSLAVLGFPVQAADSESTAAIRIEGGDIRTLVELVSKRTGRNFVIDPSVRAEVTFISGRGITDTELYDAFISILQVHGLSAIDTGNITKIVPMNRSIQNVAPIVGSGADPKTNQTAHSGEKAKSTSSSRSKNEPTPAPPSMAGSDLDFGAYAEAVPSVVPEQSRLQGEAPEVQIDTNSTSTLPSGLMEPDPRVDTYTSPDYGGTPRLAPDEIVTQVFRLQYVPAITANATLTPLAGQGDTRVQINQTSNSLIVTGRAQNVARVIELAKSIDRPNNDDFELVNLKYAVATQVAQTLQQLIGAGGVQLPDGAIMPGASNAAMRVSADERTNSVLISGDKASRERLREAIIRLDIPRKEIGGTQIIRLRYANAEEMAKTLQGISQGVQQQKAGVAEGSAGALTGAGNQVTIIPDRNTNSLVVTAPVYLYPNIRSVIAQLDVKQKAKGGTRVIALKFASAEEMAQTLQGITKGVQQNVVGTVEGATKQIADQGDSINIIPDRNTNSLVVTAPEFLFPNIYGVISQLDVKQKPKGGTIVVPLKYAKAEDLEKVLQGVSSPLQQQTKGAAEAAQGGGAAATSSGGDTTVSVIADKSTNALIITAPEFMRANLRRVIAQLDVRRGQVLIEAIIAEVSTDLAHKLGVSLAASPQDANTGGAIGISNFGNGLGQAFALSKTSTAASALGSGLLFGLGKILGGTQFGLVANALKGDAATNILATPTLVTLDNEEAKIVVGQEVPFVTGSYTNTGGGSSTPTNPFNTIERRDVGLSLIVTPQINRGKTINLKIDQEVSNLASTSVSASDVITNKRKITTNVMVEDGQVLVLGGLIEDSFRDAKEKVPVLGDLPFVGAAFRGTSTSKLKQNLMVFIHPVIMPDGEAADAYTRAKYETMQRQQVNSHVLQRGRPDQRAAQLKPLNEYNTTTVDNLHSTPQPPARTPVRQAPAQSQPPRRVVIRKTVEVHTEPTPTYAPQAKSGSID